MQRGPGPLLRRITRAEILIGTLIAAVMLVLVLIEPGILEAPFENSRTLAFTVGGTALAALTLLAMLRLRVPPAARVVVLVVPFAIVNWWLISPYFRDDVVDEAFAASIADQVTTLGQEPTGTAPESAPIQQSGAGTPATAPEHASDGAGAGVPVAPPPTTPPAPTEPAATEPPTPSGPVLLGAGQFVGLAGHSGSGDAGIFQNPDGSLVLRFENFDIENGPDLEVYLVPGPDQTSLAEGSLHLGALKGNIGDQNYELPAGSVLTSGAYTVLVWCEAFSVEFVGATVVV